jgi:5-methyltetrahydropteroyltriglutamate--homocysteine methyltransferase
VDPAVLQDLPDKTVMWGVLDLGSDEVESAETVADRLRRALEFVPPERLIAAPDCGMKYLPRERAFRKLQAMVEGAGLV